MLASEWEKKKLNVSVDLPAISFFGNADMMQHVWINLLTNAIKYTPENGELTITAAIQNKNVEIKVISTPGESSPFIIAFPLSLPVKR